MSSAGVPWPGGVRPCSEGGPTSIRTPGGTGPEEISVYPRNRPTGDTKSRTLVPEKGTEESC